MKQNKQGYSLKGGGLGLLLLALIMGLVVSGCGAESTVRVGVLAGLSFRTEIVDGFKEGMTELGYIEGENITYDVQITDFDMGAYRNILQQFVADEVDLIFVYPTEATIIAKEVTAGTDIPVVFNYVVLDVTEGMVDSVQAPGGNLTGVRYPGSEFGVLRYEMLRDIVPNLERVLIPYQRGYPTVQSQLDGIYAQAEADGVTIIELPADDGTEIAAFFQTQAEAGDFDVDAILTLIEPLGGRPDAFAAISSFAKERNIPIGGTYTEAEEYSSIFGIWVEPFSSGMLAAPLADKIIQGIEPGTIPIVSPEPHIQVNYQMAQELGIQIPDTLLARANQIYR